MMKLSKETWTRAVRNRFRVMDALSSCCCCCYCSQAQLESLELEVFARTSRIRNAIKDPWLTTHQRTWQACVACPIHWEWKPHQFLPCHLIHPYSSLTSTFQLPEHIRHLRHLISRQKRIWCVVHGVPFGSCTIWLLWMIA